MDPTFFQGRGMCTYFELGAYLGPSSNEKEQNRKAILFFQHFGIIPSQATEAFCICGEKYSTISDIRNNVLGFRWKCKSGHCTVKTLSPLKGTLLDKAKLEPGKILKIFWCWFFKMNVSEAASQTAVRPNTATVYYRIFQEVARKAEGHEYEKIGGSDDVVELDESHLFKRKHNKGRSLKAEKEAIWMYGGISRKTGRCFAVRVDDRTKVTLHREMKEHVQENTYIMTDCWKGYLGCEKGGAFKGHRSVNHKKNFVDPKPVEIKGLSESLYGLPTALKRQLFPLGKGIDNIKAYAYARDRNLVTVHTQKIERMWREMKEYLRYRHGDNEMVDNIVGEFLYRHNILEVESQDRATQMIRILSDIKRVYPGNNIAPIVDKKGERIASLRKIIEETAAKTNKEVNMKGGQTELKRRVDYRDLNTLCGDQDVKAYDTLESLESQLKGTDCLELKNVYGIVDAIVHEPRKYCKIGRSSNSQAVPYMVRISDKTKSDVLVHLSNGVQQGNGFQKMSGIGPKIQVNDILRIHRATVRMEKCYPDSAEKEMIISTSSHLFYTIFNPGDTLMSKVDVSRLAKYSIPIKENDGQLIFNLRKLIHSRSKTINKDSVAVAGIHNDALDCDSYVSEMSQLHIVGTKVTAEQESPLQGTSSMVNIHSDSGSKKRKQTFNSLCYRNKD